MASIDHIINRQLLKWEYSRAHPQPAESSQADESFPHIVTVSRQKGSRGSYFARRLAEELNYTCLHREVIDAICQSSGYMKRIVDSLDEQFRNDIELMIESLFLDRSVDHHDYIRHLYRVVHSMSKLGGIVLIGRGGNFILGPDKGCHIRVIAPNTKRVEALMKYENMTAADAGEAIKDSDATRRQFVHKLFGREIEDPSGYDLVLNSGSIDVEEMVEAARLAIKGKFEKQTGPANRKERA